MNGQKRNRGDDFLGQGLYTIPEASRLTRIPVDTVRRWILGYSYRLSPRSRKSLRGRASKPPVVVPSLPRLGQSVALSFLELMELHVVKALKERGVSLQRIRRASEEAREVSDTPYPFAWKPIFTDGRDVFMKLEAGAELDRILQLGSGGQWVLEPVLRSFLKRIEFDPSTKLAKRWWPLGRSAGILVDPAVSFGAPILETAGICTVVLWEATRQEPIDAVAKWYQIEASLVTTAIRFEASIRAA
jgi:DNA-binding transcriptional MerR regulator